jgi:hypothetical protein
MSINIKLNKLENQKFISTINDLVNQETAVAITRRTKIESNIKSNVSSDLKSFRDNKFKLLLLIKILIFNMYFFGFLFNFITYQNSSWMRNQTYMFGMFKYCHLNETLMQTISYAFQIQGNTLIYRPIQELRCFSWNNHNRPSNILMIIINTVSYAYLF